MASTSKNSLPAWAIIAMLALLGLNGYQWFVNNQIQTENTRQETELVELEKVNAELDQDYQTALSSLESMRGDNQKLNDLIESQKRELTTQKDKINKLIWSKRELTKAREEIKTLNDQAAGFIVQLQKLQEENALLASNNTQLQQQNATLTTQYNEVEQARASLVEERAVLAAEKERLAESNEALGEKVDIATAIKINWMEVTGYQLKDDGKRKRKRRAKNIDALDVCFKTETNMVVPAGNTDFQVRFIDPKGETIAIESAGSGVLENKLDGTKVRYTYSGPVEYNNADTEACLAWKIGDYPLQKGIYEVEMYNNGFLVGKGNFKLK